MKIIIYCAQAHFKKLNQEMYNDTLGIYDGDLGSQTSLSKDQRYVVRVLYQIIMSLMSVFTK